MPLDIPDDLQKAAVAKSINDYINHYITVMDTKASVLLAGNVAAASFLLKDMPADAFGKAAYIVSMSLFGISTFVAGGVIMPRRPPAGNNIIFWGDIAARPDFKTYLEDFQRVLNGGFIDEQYCVQNYLASKVMRRKYNWMRASMMAFFAALFAGFAVYLWTSHHA